MTFDQAEREMERIEKRYPEGTEARYFVPRDRRDWEFACGIVAAEYDYRVRQAERFDSGCY